MNAHATALQLSACGSAVLLIWLAFFALRCRWVVQRSDSLFLCLGAYLCFVMPVTFDRYILLAGGNVLRHHYNVSSATELVQAGSCARWNYETQWALVLGAIHVYLSNYVNIRPSNYLALLHVSIAWYVACRFWLAESNAVKFMPVLDGGFLYIIFLLLYFSCRRHDLQLRSSFARSEQLRAAHREAEAGRERAESELVALRPGPLTAAQARDVISELGPDLSENAQLRRAHIDFSALHLQRSLGEGNFAMVHLATWAGALCAVKQLKRGRLNEVYLQAFKAECCLHLTLRHPNIVSLLGVSFDRAVDGHVCPTPAPRPGRAALPRRSAFAHRFAQ